MADSSGYISNRILSNIKQINNNTLSLNEESKNIFDLSLSLMISGMTRTVAQPILKEKKYDK